MAKLIYLSPSNHGTGANKCKKSGCYEDKHTRPIAEVCARHLKNNGFDVVIAKTTQSMAARCSESDSKKAVLHVPIHTNAFSNESARYLMFMFYRDNDAYHKIFNAVAPYVEEVYPGKLKAKFAKRTDLYEINAPSAKSMYCELGFPPIRKIATNLSTIPRWWERLWLRVYAITSVLNLKKKEAQALQEEVRQAPAVHHQR
ncbi:MAG: N-acetylmuramoyl-L-alanine amidase [Anaerovoracaceae bacterium]